MDWSLPSRSLWSVFGFCCTYSPADSLLYSGTAIHLLTNQRQVDGYAIQLRFMEQEQARMGCVDVLPSAGMLTNFRLNLHKFSSFLWLVSFRSTFQLLSDDNGTPKVNVFFLLPVHPWQLCRLNPSPLLPMWSCWKMKPRILRNFPSPLYTSL